ncbi:hypothetical protein NC652_013816 [Populus alba x Populus x berolinensis]|nr:hypothetical protein NC652_013816 [Populus alba x Populus x berolinensis]
MSGYKRAIQPPPSCPSTPLLIVQPPACGPASPTILAGSSPLMETKPSLAAISMSSSSPAKSLSMSIASDLWHHQRQLEQRSDVEDRSLSTFSNAFDSSPTLKRDLWAVQSGQRCEQSQPLRIAQSTCRGFAAPRTEVLLWMILFQQLHDGCRDLVIERDLIKPDRAVASPAPRAHSNILQARPRFHLPNASITSYRSINSFNPTSHFSDSNNHSDKHKKANKVIKIEVFLVSPRHPGSICKTSSINHQHNQSLLNQQRQLMQNQNVTRQTRQLESELGGEDCPSTVDSRVSHSNMSIYGQDLMPIHPANFALMNPTPMGSAYSASGNTGEKKPQQPQTLAFKASDIS